MRLDQRRTGPEALGHAVLGHRAARGRRARRDAAPVTHVTAEPLVDQSAPPHRARDQGQVHPMDGVRAELTGEVAMGRVGLRDHQHPARALVEAVDQPGPRAPSVTGGDVVHEPVEQRAAPVPGAGVHHEPRRLVDHQQVRVLVEHVERERLGLDRGRLTHRHVAGDHVAGPDQPRGLGRAAVDRDQAALDPPLRERAGEMRGLGGDEDVEAPRCLPRGHRRHRLHRPAPAIQGIATGIRPS